MSYATSSLTLITIPPYFNDKISVEHTVAGCEIAMDVSLRRQIRHPVGDIASHVQQVSFKRCKHTLNTYESTENKRLFTRNCQQETVYDLTENKKLSSPEFFTF